MAVNIGNQTSSFSITNTTIHVLAQSDSIISSGTGIVTSGVADEKVVVAGAIYTDSNGMAFGTAPSGTNIVIQETGTVVGNTGVFLPADRGQITNHGSVTGQTANAIDIGVADDATVMNTGTVGGETSGIRSTGDRVEISNSGVISGGDGIRTSGEMTIYNSGVISGLSQSFAALGTGINVTNTSADTVTLYNSGTVSGGVESYSGGVGRDVVFNSGVMDGSVVLDSGDDVYRASGNGVVQGNVRGGGGDDDIRGAAAADELVGGNGNDKIKGRGGEDTLEGGNGRDIMLGGDGDDEITGGNAGDLMLGGAGADVFLFTDTGDVGTTGATRDEIRDFAQGEDVINLSAMVGPDFIFLGAGSFTGGAAPELRLVEAGGSTFVQLDYDGDGSQDGRMLVRGVVDMLETDFIL